MSRVITLGKDWWKSERPALDRKEPIQVRYRSIKDIELWTIEFVANKLGRSEEWVRRRIRSGELRSQPVGNSYRIPSDAVDEMLEVMRRKGVG